MIGDLKNMMAMGLQETDDEEMGGIAHFLCPVASPVRMVPGELKSILQITELINANVLNISYLLPQLPNMLEKMQCDYDILSFLVRVADQFIRDFYLSETKQEFCA